MILGGREVTLAQQYAAITVASIPLFVIAGAGNKNNFQAVINYCVNKKHENVSFITNCSYFFLNLGTAVFWVIGASIFLIALHASFYNHDALDLPLDDSQKLTGQIIEDV